MSLKIKISEDLKSSMKEKNVIRLAILRVLKSEIERNEQSASGKVELPDGDIIKLVKKLIESIKETTKNQEEIDALDVYLPKQMTFDEIKSILNSLKGSGVNNMGDFMKYFKSNHDGQYDGKVLSGLVKEIL